MIVRTNTLLLSVALAGLVLAGCGVGTASPAQNAADISAAPLPVQVIKPETREIFATYQTTTTVFSDRDAPIVARVAGEVVEIFVEEGDRVKKGQILARLDGDRLHIQLQQSKANLEKTEREYQRVINLHERGLVSTAAFDGMQFDLDALRAGFELGKLNYSYTFLKASIAGVVSAREIKTGQHVNAGDTTFRVTDSSELIAYLQIPQNELGNFSVGHIAHVKVDSLPGQAFDATVERISPTIDARNGTFRATAIIPNDAGLLAPGMFARFSIAYDKHSDALVVPKAAVIEEDNVSVVYVVETSAAQRRIVTIGIEANGQVEILTGLSENDQVILNGQSGIRDGSKVLASIAATDAITG